MHIRACLPLALATALCATAAASAQEPKYLEVPLAGTFGEEIYPLGVVNVLTKAKEAGVTHVIFRIKSSGGQVWAARSIAEVLRAHDEAFTYVAVIEDALSASLWPAMHCDTIIMTPGARIGAAVVFKNDKTSGAAAVDAKLNSALAAEVAAAAEVKGHSALLVRAMMLPEVLVYALERQDGTIDLVDTRPTRTERGITISTLSDAQGVLTLTGTEAARYGLAVLQNATTAEATRTTLSIRHWEAGGDFVEATIKDAAKKCDALVAKATKLEGDAIEAFNTYREQIPERFTYPVTGSTKKLTKEGRTAWEDHTDKAIAGLSRFRTKLKALVDLGSKDGKAAAMDGYFAVERGPKDMMRTLDAVDREIKRLRTGRGRTNLE